MVICPKCKSKMVYRCGEKNGREYEFYGCSNYPRCNKIVEMHEKNLYDNGIKSNNKELSIEEEGERLRDILIKDGWDRETAEYAKYSWEKDK